MKYWDGGHFILWRALLASEVCLGAWGFVVSQSFLGLCLERVFFGV